MKSILFYFGCTFLFVIFSLPSLAGFAKLDTIQISNNWDTALVLKDNHLWMFCDTTHSMRYEDVQKLHLSHFQPVKKGNIHLEKKHTDFCWFKFVISNISNESVHIVLGFDRLDLVDLYQKTGQGIDSLKGGRFLSIQDRVFPDERSLPAMVSANQIADFLFNTRIVGKAYDSYQFSIQPTVFYNQHRLQAYPIIIHYNLWQGFFYGFINFVMLFSIIQFILEKDRIYVYYALYLLGIVIYYLIGGTMNMLTPFSYAIEQTHSIKLTVSFFIFFMYVLFFVEFLYEKKEENPLVIKILNLAVKLLFICFIIDIFLRGVFGIIFYDGYYDELRYFLLAIAIIAAFAMIKPMRKDYYAKYILIGTLLLLFFGLINFPLYMKLPGHIKGGISYTQIGILVEVVCFSIGLSLRSRGQLLKEEQSKVESQKQLNQEKLATIQIQKDKALFQQQLAETELKALRAQINPHFISNALNAIKLMVQKKQGEKAADYLADFSNLIRTILLNSDEQFISLQRELDYCGLYLKIESLRFDKGFTYQIKVEENIDTTYVKIPPLLLQPYIENAIWHGLLPKAGLRHLAIIVKNMGENIHCVIEDNGIGRKLVEAQEIPNLATKKSYGLAITNERIKINNDLYEAGLAVNIIDKKSKSGQATGTRVELIMPL